MNTKVPEVAKWKSIEVFCCYAHTDRDQLLLEELQKHLQPLQDMGLITQWADNDISAGEEEIRERDRHLNMAQIILLLISPDFMNSEDCYRVQMPLAMERFARGEARVIPIILRPVHWKGTPFGKLQALPTDGTPVTKWQNQDSAFFDVAEGIRKAIEKDIRKAIDELNKQASLLDQLRDDTKKNPSPFLKSKQGINSATPPSAEPTPVLLTADSITQETHQSIKSSSSPYPALVEPNKIVSDPPPSVAPQTKSDPPKTPRIAPVRTNLVLQWIQEKRKNVPIARRVLLLVMLALCLTGTIGGILYFHFRPTPTPTTTICAICVQQEPDGETIGISDGKFAFDIGRNGSNFMKQAAQSFQNGEKSSAESLWNQAAQADTGNAEAWIYLEDQRVLTSGAPYIDIVVATMLTGNSDTISVGRDNLQGGYVAQKYFNDGHLLHNGVKIRLLIANSGCQVTTSSNQDLSCSGDSVIRVARQIAQLPKVDPHFVGVMGWPYSAPTLEVLPTLKDAHIPMVSQSASSDELTGKSPYFFRANPSNSTEGVVDAQYAEGKPLSATRVALFVDPNNSYSRTLAKDFSDQFIKDGNSIVATEPYTVFSPQNDFNALLTNAESKNRNPNLIYFSGYAADASVLLTDLPRSDTFASLHVMGGDALNEQDQYKSSSFAAGWRLRFTTFAHPDEWGALCTARQTFACNPPEFFSDYKAAFDPNHKYPSGKYGYERASSGAIMSYDAMLTILTAAQRILAGSKTSLTPDDLLYGLQQIKGTLAVQGVSGQISFDSNGNPTNKALVIAKISPQGFIKIDSVQGCFQVGQTEPCPNISSTS